MKENTREDIFANIDSINSGDKPKIKVDTEANGNMILLRIKKNNVPTRRQQQNGKTDCHLQHENTAIRVNNIKN